MTSLAHAVESEALLYLDGITVDFDGFKALDTLSLYLERGEMRAVIGPNGAGKSTMMDVITGKTRPAAGIALFAGRHDLAALDEAAIANLGIGRKFQKPTVFESQTVAANLELALKADRGVFAALRFRPSPTQRERIDHVLEIVALEDHCDDVAGSLSHGQKQWLEIGMLLMQDPELLLVDEPAAGMTDAETMRTAELLKDIARTHTVVVVEHDMAFVRALDTKVTVLHEGSVLAEGPLDFVQNDQAVIDVDLHYGASQALRRVSLAAAKGHVTCVLGRNGVGKTSLLRAIIGQQPVTRGTIAWDDADITAQSSTQRARRGIAVVPQGREIFPLLTVEENLRTGFAALPRAERYVLDEVFSLFPVLGDMLRRRGGDLSGGQQQQLAIARALVMRPRLLLLDEPTEGIQPSIIKEIGSVIDGLRRRGDMAIVLVEQYFAFARDLADRFVVMDRGEVVMAGAAADMVESDVRRHLTV